ncbi:hypothetical protein PFISCL1PPCAC_19792 [Pristionchus fissidentatus]|uniref:F-box domain-containing protein n=1 Tax=Pristionchus fissidentatus TaxID=1538716 RepID=A0AAV5WCZ2_9BILA|nr:hypothetical protein PFISCL1PPCAC_19792 [Pristionchus fissidentatus]
MPFMGQDWRGPGEKWIKTPLTNGWERTKLRPIQISSEAIPIKSSTSFDDDLPISNDEGRGTSSDELSDEEPWIPHCFVKSKSKEFIGCTSMSEAFHRLDLARAVSDIRRFSYVCKVVSILVEEKLRNLSATARKSLLSIITAIVVRASEEDLDISTARRLLNFFSEGLEGHVYGSPLLTAKHQLRVGSLLDAVSSVHPRPIEEIDNTGVTFLDLPRELISLVLSRLSDSKSLIEISKSHQVFEGIVDNEMTMWRRLVSFHFSPLQIEVARREKDLMTWRDTFFHLRKMHVLREVYADVIHICCHCKALFWNTLGHPCIRPSSPSVRVTPQQFVDMLLLL